MSIPIFSENVRDKFVKKITKYLKESLITASIGHSAASYQEVIKAINNGLTCSTHTYNAQKGIHHREVGVVGLVSDDF